MDPQKDKVRSQTWNFYSQNARMTFKILDPRRKYSMIRYHDIYCNSFVSVIAYQRFSHIKWELHSEFFSFYFSELLICPKEYQLNWILVNNDNWLLSHRNCDSVSFVILSRSLRGIHSLKQGNKFKNSGKREEAWKWSCSIPRVSANCSGKAKIKCTRAH